MEWNRNAAVDHAKGHANARSLGRCAEYTREAISAGGVEIGHTNSAKDYGILLENAGFRAIGIGENLLTGDVVIIQPYPGGNRNGHMAIFDGTTWYSDFRQRDMWAGPGYRSAHPSYVIYRKN
ncbi:hypothetical protein [Citrobacter enshiensis]|uniref:hypothetical protein n=1 Tax=Citrobacter enshiensis TaxID=2971264 RepID=UPI0023E8B7AA|nr:hypothetical protein [Citrobacter enshiensis]WET40358.1 hypothetical protein P2W74_21350 [Citrobacter enshiensis]